MKMKTDKTEVDRFAFLQKTAMELGATDAKVIPASDVCVENRVPLKCRAGCIGYGKKLTCPPYVPTPEEFSRILNGYSFVLIVKFRAPAPADDNLVRSIYKSTMYPAAPDEKGEERTGFRSEVFAETPQILDTMLKLEKLAFSSGCSSALALVKGSCRLCETCNVKNGVCLHPNMSRIPEHAVGIDIKRTAELAGISVRNQKSGRIEPMALLLID